MKHIVVTGGSGFVGQSLCAALRRQWPDAQIVVPSRSAPPAANPHAITWVKADIHSPAEQQRLLQGADALVQLVAILHGSAAAFERVHVALQRNLAQAARQAGVARVVQVSALAVGEDAPSNYLRSKARGEAVWQSEYAAHGGRLTLLRPSVIFGERDAFTNMFARMLRWLPVMPLPGATSRYAPVWVEDVAQAIVCLLALNDPPPVLQAAGPEELTLKQIVQRIAEQRGWRRLIIGLPEPVALAQAGLMQVLPGPTLMSVDNVRSMRAASVDMVGVPGLHALNISARPLGR